MCESLSHLPTYVYPIVFIDRHSFDIYIYIYIQPFFFLVLLLKTPRENWEKLKEKIVEIFLLEFPVYFQWQEKHTKIYYIVRNKLKLIN